MNIDLNTIIYTLIGVVFTTGLITFSIKKIKNIKQSQENGSNSINIQINGDKND